MFSKGVIVLFFLFLLACLAFKQPKISKKRLRVKRGQLNRLGGLQGHKMKFRRRQPFNYTVTKDVRIPKFARDFSLGKFFKNKRVEEQLGMARFIKQSLEGNFLPLRLDSNSLLFNMSSVIDRGLDEQLNMLPPRNFCPIGEVGINLTTCPMNEVLAIVAPASPAAFGGNFFLQPNRTIALNCKPLVDCSTSDINSRYRTISGICNNLEVNQFFGASGSDLKRIVPAVNIALKGYPQVFSYNNIFLPNAQAVSKAIHATTDKKPVNNTLVTEDDVAYHSNGSVVVDDTGIKDRNMLFMLFGQFLDHDIGLTPEIVLTRKNDVCGNDTDCCSFVSSPGNIPRGCLPMAAIEDRECLDFKASITSCSTQEPVNTNTAFIDGSVIYGSIDGAANRLRTFKDGLLKVEKRDDDDYLPIDRENNCPNRNIRLIAGDDRNEENTLLTILHILFLKEHNRIATILKKRHFTPLTDDILYHESRRIVWAQLQNIVYSEWLPLVLGKEKIIKNGLDITGGTLYNKTIDASLINAHSTAAFRFGHTLITSIIPVFNETEVVDSIRLKDLFMNGTTVFQLGSNKLIESILFGFSAKGDRVITNDVRDTSGFPTDLPARNIQRGRDHRIGFYNAYRLFCGLQPLPANFSKTDIPKEFTEEAWNALSTVYKTPQIIELFPGGLSETLIPDGKVGPTFACLIIEQFRRFLIGDRFFFTHINIDDNIKFLNFEKKAILKRTMRDVICENSDIKKVQLHAFLPITDSNPLIECTKLNKLNFLQEDTFFEF